MHNQLSLKTENFLTKNYCKVELKKKKKNQTYLPIAAATVL